MTEHERRELEWTWTGSGPVLPLKRGDSGPKVKQVQEWLTLHGFGTAIDGDFGPATEAALKAFQRHEAEERDGDLSWVTGEVEPATWEMLTEPMHRVVEFGRDFADNVVGCAHLHLSAAPREVGGPNSGPWVRLYMDGHEGPDWPWCAGFATYVLRQALGHDKWRTFSCDELATKGMVHGGFILAGEEKRPEPGSLFLIRAEGAVPRPKDWTHCGIVTAVGSEHFETVEGNTDQGGSREGTKVCKRVRAFNSRTDFVLIGSRDE